MSTDPQHQKQNKSMFILLSIISVLVISTLVVASIYFLKPSIESTSNTPLKTQKSPTSDTSFKHTKLDSTANQKITSTAITTTHPPQDGCNIHFIENQLLVKNSDRSK